MLGKWDIVRLIQDKDTAIKRYHQYIMQRAEILNDIQSDTNALANAVVARHLAGVDASRISTDPTHKILDMGDAMSAAEHNLNGYIKEVKQDIAYWNYKVREAFAFNGAWETALLPNERSVLWQKYGEGKIDRAVEIDEHSADYKTLQKTIETSISKLAKAMYKEGFEEPQYSGRIIDRKKLMAKMKGEKKNGNGDKQENQAVQTSVWTITS